MSEVERKNTYILKEKKRKREKEKEKEKENTFLKTGRYKAKTGRGRSFENRYFKFLSKTG
jgi:hypothetical protein